MVKKLNKGMLMAIALLSSLTASQAIGAADNQAFKEGEDLVAKKSYKEAISLFDKAIAEDPKHYDAYLERALCNYHLEKYAEVVEDCNKVTSSDASDIFKRQAYMVCSGAQNALGKYEDAIKSSTEAIKLAPKASLSYSDKAFALQKLHRLDEALKDCDEAIKLDPGHPSNYQMRAAIYEAKATIDRIKYRQLLQTRKGGEKPWKKLLEEQTSSGGSDKKASE